VLKQHADADDVESLVEQELERLSIAAFAMFNRDAQVVTETDLNDDLTALSGETPSRYGTNRRRMSDARLLIGRFFFVHAAESTYGVTGEAPLRAYEFLHATFGEYLVARLTVKTTTALYESTRGRRTLTTVAQTVDDGLLTALLSYQVLTMRGPILEFLGHLFADRPPEERAGLHQLLLDLLHDCLEAYDPGRFAGYRPRHLSLTSRLATRSANLIILLLALTNAPIEYNSLWPDADNPTDTWQRLSRLWQATLEKESWDSLAKALSATPWHSPTAVQTGPTPRFGRDAFTDWGLFWNLVAANSLIGDDLVRSLLISVQPLVERNDAIFTTPESGLSPARLIIEFWQGFAYRDHFSFIHMNDIFDLCLDAANGLDYVGQHQYLLMLFEALSRTGVAMSVEALTRAATLVMDGSGWSALEAAHLIAAIGNAFRQTTPRDQRLRDIALGVASTFNEARHFQPEPERLWVAMALAEMGVTPPTGHGLRLEELLEHPGAAWRLIHNDEDAFRRLVRAARYAEHDSAAAAVLGILDMMPGPKLAALPWRDVLITVARANHENPALAEKVVTAWDRARKRLKLTTGAVTT
jgi:hypothetical protein